MLSVPPTDGPDGQVQLHASTVVIAGKAVAFCGPAGAGKSGAALACLARGATLLADDITWLAAAPDGLIASCPPRLSGKIEARGIGILNADAAPPTPLCLIVDLGTPEPHRLPEPKTVQVLGHDIAVLHTPATDHFIDAVMHYVVNGRAT